MKKKEVISLCVSTIYKIVVKINIELVVEVLEIEF